MCLCPTCNQYATKNWSVFTFCKIMKRPKFFKLYDFRRISRKFADTLGNRRLCLDLFKLPMATMFSFFERICNCTEVTAAKRVSSKHEVPVTVVADRFGPKRKQNSGKSEKQRAKRNASNQSRTDDLHITSVAPYQLGHRSCSCGWGGTQLW